MNITLRQEHIDNGRKYQSQSSYDPRCQCPIALAISEAIEEQIMVSQDQAFIRGEDPISLPAKVKIFIDTFDKNQSVAPFIFPLDEL